MSERLKKLLSLNEQLNRSKVALRRAYQGRKVIGIGCSHVPEELVSAAGLLSYRLTGAGRGVLANAGYYRPTMMTEPYTNNVLESALTGDFDFLDGMICTNWDDDRRQLYDIWKHLRITPFVHFLHLPRNDNELAIEEFANQLSRLRDALEKFTNMEIPDEKIWESIELYNSWRKLMMYIYEMRKKERPPLSGGEAMRLTNASFVMSKEQMVSELNAVLPELEDRQCSLSSWRCRLVITGDMADNPAFIDLIEECGGLVVMDDLEAGSRYFWKVVDTNGDPLYALAKRYLRRPPGARAFFWDKGIDQLIDWSHEYNANGVIELCLRDSFSRLYGRPHLTKRLAEANIRNTSLIVEYHIEMEEQLRTRVEAFIESL